MADNILKRIWNFIIRKKKLSSEDKLIISELKALYRDKNQDTLKKQQELLQALEGSNDTKAADANRVAATDEDKSTDSSEQQEELEEDDTAGTAVLAQMFECKQIWDDFDAVYDYINRLLEGGDFVEKKPADFLRDLALQEELLNKIELEFENLRKDKFVEPEEREAVNSRLGQIRKLIEEKKAELSKRAKDDQASAAKDTSPPSISKEDISAEPKDQDADNEANETADKFTEDMAALIDNLSEKHNLKLSSAEVAALMQKIKHLHLRKLFEEKIKVLDARSRDFVRDFDKAGFDKPYIPNPSQELRFFDTEKDKLLTRDELLQKLGIFLTDSKAQADLNKMIAPQIKLLKTKGQEIIERRKKQYQSSVNVFIAKNGKNKEKTEIPKELAVPIAQVLKKHMALSIDRENGFINKHKSELFNDAHNVVLNGKKQIVEAQRKKVEQDQKSLKLKSQQRKKEQERKNKAAQEKQEAQAESFKHNLRQQQNEALKKNELLRKKEEHEQYMRHMEFMAHLQEKKKRYYKMRQDTRIAAKETQKRLLESKIDTTEKQIVELQNTLNEYEKNKTVNRKQTEERMKQEAKVMRSHINQQREQRKEMHKQYLAKMAEEEKNRQMRIDQMHNKMHMQADQAENQQEAAKERIANMREQERKILAPKEHESVKAETLVGRRFNKIKDVSGSENKEYHRDFSQFQNKETQSQNTADSFGAAHNNDFQNTEEALKDGLSELKKAKQNGVSEETVVEASNIKETEAAEKKQAQAVKIEPKLAETEAELDKALKEKADKIRKDAVAENKKKQEQEATAKVTKKIKETKEVFQEEIQKKEEHKEEVLKELTTKQETVRKELEEKKKAEEERMQEIKRLRDTAITEKKQKQAEIKKKQVEENKKRQQEMLDHQKKKREEIKRKMEEEKKRREEVKRKMEADKKKRAAELKKKREEEQKKREEAKRKLEAKQKKAKDMAAKKMLKQKEAEDKLRREKMLKAQEEKRKKAREAMKNNNDF